MQPLIEITRISHAYGDGPARKTVLHDISVAFYPGEIAIIMGPSGAGKTTLLSLAGALRSLQSGEIRVGNVKLSGASRSGLRGVRRRIGFIFQAHNLVEALSACENVQLALATDSAFTRAASLRKALELLELVGMAEHAHKKPRELSGGQKQRVAIARALVRSPEIIMADEPTASLDSHSGRAVVELLQHLARQIGCAVLLVTHDSRILDIADRVLTLEDGAMEETHLTLDRLAGEAAGWMGLLARLPGLLYDAPALAALRGEFAANLTRWMERASTVAARLHAGETGVRAQRWIEIAEHLRYLDDSLGRSRSSCSRSPPGGSRSSAMSSCRVWISSSLPPPKPAGAVPRTRRACCVI